MAYQRRADFKFSVIFDDELIKDYPPCDFEPLGNETLVSIVNDFEEGEWRYGKFFNFVLNNIKETALTAAERQACLNKEGDILSVAANRLRIEAQKDCNSRGSEIAEILLYGLMREYYGALPAVPKIWHKQNRQMTAKGADSIHVIVKEDDEFELWLGEAKFYEDIGAAMAKAVESVEDTISLAAIRKENSFITELDDLKMCLHEKFPERAESLWGNISKLLDNNTSIDELKPILHIPILLLHECQITQKETIFSNDYKRKIKEAHLNAAKRYFKGQTNALKLKVSLYGEIHFHLILFPVPRKQDVVEGFYRRIEPFRE